jgi:hypothetical protein
LHFHSGGNSKGTNVTALVHQNEAQDARTESLTHILTLAQIVPPLALCHTMLDSPNRREMEPYHRCLGAVDRLRRDGAPGAF